MTEKQSKKHSKLDNFGDKLNQWEKGESGNPNGRPKGTGLTDLLLKEIELACPDDKQKRSWKANIVIATMKLAMRGNTAALKEIWERMDGKVTLPIEQMGDLTLTISSEYMPEKLKRKSE